MWHLALASSDFAPLIFILFLCVAIGLGIFGFVQERKRREALHGWAREKGLAFHPDRDHGYEDRYRRFACLRRGHNRYAYNIARGTLAGREVCCFDYHYETYSRDNKGRRQTHHHHFSAVVVEYDLPLKPLFIRPENFFDKVTEFFGYDDIDFELDEFSRCFYVKAPDRQWAYDVIHQATMEFLLECPRFTLDFQGTQVMAYRGGRFKPEDFESAVMLISGILDRLPNYLIQELKGVSA